MSAYAGPVCGKCHKGMIGDQGLTVSEEWEHRFRNKYVNLCDTCKRNLMMEAIARGASLPGDLPGHEHTNVTIENNDDNFDSDKPDFLNEEWYKAIKRQSLKEAQAIAEAIALLGKTFNVKNIAFGHQGDQFEKNESTLIIKLKSLYDQSK